MKKIIVLMGVLLSIQAFAQSEREGGGGHVVIDENGDMTAIDDYNEDGAVGRGFEINQVCPNGNATQIDISKGVLAKAYKSAVSRFEILNKPDSSLSYKIIQNVIHSMRWYTCAEKLPQISDHRFAQYIMKDRIVQLALQNSKSEVVLSQPILDQLLELPKGEHVIESNMIHEILLSALGFKLDRDRLSQLVRGLFDGDKKSLYYLTIGDYLEKDYLYLAVNVYGYRDGVYSGEEKTVYQKLFYPKHQRISVLFTDDTSLEWTQSNGLMSYGITNDGKLRAVSESSFRDRLRLKKAKEKTVKQVCFDQIITGHYGDRNFKQLDVKLNGSLLPYKSLLLAELKNPSFWVLNNEKWPDSRPFEKGLINGYHINDKICVDIARVLGY